MLTASPLSSPPESVHRSLRFESVGTTPAKHEVLTDALLNPPLDDEQPYTISGQFWIE